MASQFGTLSINDNEASIGSVNSSSVSFDQGARSVSAHIICTAFFDNSSPIFDFFVQNQPAKVVLTLNDFAATGGQATRTIEFENAVCKDYLEVFDLQNKSANDTIDLLIEFTIQADSVTMGDTTFPA
jgi:hypothetical protein